MNKGRASARTTRACKRAAVDKALRKLRIPRWGIERLRVMIWLGIRDSVRSYVLDSETESGYGQREVGWVEREGVANFVLKL